MLQRIQNEGFGAQFFAKSKNIDILLILLLQVVLYGRVLHFDFVWDDFFLIQNNPYFLKPFDFFEIFGSAFWKFSSINNPVPYYRPFVTLSYLIEYKIFGKFPGGYHLVNLTTHLANVFLIWVIAQKFKLNRLGAFVGALLFSVHPTSVHTVCFVSSYGDILCAFFSLMTILFWMSERKIRWFALVWAFAAMLTKETGIVLPAVLFFYELIAKNDSDRKFQKWLPFLIWFPYLILRYYGLKDTAVYVAQTPWIWDSLGSFRILKFMVRILYPVPCPPQVDLLKIPLYISVQCHVAYFLMIWIVYLKTKTMPIARFFFMWFFLSTLLIADWFGYGLRFSDQFLYIPLIPVAFLCGFIINFKNKVPYLFVPLSIAFISIMPGQISSWKNGIELWSNALQQDSENPLFSLNYSIALSKNGRREEGCTWMRRTRDLIEEKKISSYNSITYTGLGNCIVNSNKELAKEYYKVALESDKDYFPAKYALIVVLVIEKKNDEALKQAQLLAQDHPDNPASWNLLSSILKIKGDESGSKQANERARFLENTD